ncbi:MAG: hypothetical protein WAO19_09775 [Candidatus Kryptoniota bacterium]
MLYPKPYLAVIYVEYDREKYSGAFERLKSYLCKLDQNRISYIRVNNMDEGNGMRNLDGNTIYLQGNNIDREFSGWQKGLSVLSANEVPFDVVLFVNDSFEVNGTSYLNNHNVGWLILKSYLFKAVFGLIATRWEKTLVHGKSTRVWLGTHCFFVPRTIVEKLGTMVSVDEHSFEDYLPKTFPGMGEIFKQTAPINQATKKRIISWLTQGWHSKLVLGEATWPLFRAKAKAILNEELVSVRIREMGYLILPYDIPLFVFAKLRGAFRRAIKIVLHKRLAIGDDAFNGQSHNEAMT